MTPYPPRIHSPVWRPAAPLLLLCLSLGFQLLSVAPATAQISLDREPPGPSSRRTGLVLTEIMYNPRPVPGWPTNLTLEFIEFFNSKPWDEDIGGFMIDGTVRYRFPSNAVLRAGAYLVVARVPGLMQTNYAVTNVFGPWEGAETNRLSPDSGTVRLRNRTGAILLQTDYRDSPPWPEAADGTGHSLVLARPSLGENNPQAWSESDVVGGSPGKADAMPQEPLASVYINEWRNHSDPDDLIELYNHSNTAVDMSGAWLSDDPTTNKFRIPDGTTIAPRGFLAYNQAQLGFELFAGGETILLVNSNQSRVIDIIDFRGQSNNVTSGRFPDGGPFVYGLTSNTIGAPNSRPLRYPVVITEIMYNPISGNNDDEYIEIYNRGSSPVNISGWSFVVGINYVFPTNVITQNMPPGAYWVVGRNLTNLFAIYPNLNTNNTFGPYTGTLANGGERVVFAAADYDRVVGQPTEEKLDVPISDVTYGDGGKWGNWHDGLGSSLELIDVEADGHLPSNWADSTDVSESSWTAIESTVPLGESLGDQINDRLIIALQGVGECLIDAIEVRVDNGPNILVNGGFESGLTGWQLQGSHDFSTLENPGFEGGTCLHVRAGSRGDNQSNRILSPPFPSPIPPTAQQVSIRIKAKWLRGLPEVLCRLRGSATEAYGRMALPRRLGSPGAPNSTKVANAGPAIYNVAHAPILPPSGAPVVVTARASDPNGPLTLNLRYRLDPSPDFINVAMVDNGTGGDAIANDGIYSATIPGQPAGQIVAFYVEGRDGLNAIGTFPNPVFPPAGLTRCWPNDAVARECVVRWGEVQMPGDFATYHLWLTSANSNRWHIRDAQNNTEMDGTFVYNNSRVIYNALPLYSGSPWHRTNALTGPAGINRTDYEMNFPEDDAFLGATDFVLANPGNPNILTISDLTALAEQTVYKIFDGMGLICNHRRYVHLFVNGNQRSKALERAGNFIFEDSQQPNGDMIAQWFPEDAGGLLFKMEDWFEFQDNGFDITAYNDADLERRTVRVDGVPTFLPGPYRFMFRKRSVNVGASANDYAVIYELIDAVSPADSPTSPTIDPDAFGAVSDWEAWMRHFAVQRTVGNFDSYGWDRGKNDYLYRPVNSGCRHMPWDIDYCLGLGRPADEPLFASSDSRVLAMFNTPALVRAYWRAFAELVSGPFTPEVLYPFIDSRTAALVANNIDIDLAAVDSIKTYIAARRAYLQTQLATVAAAFAVDVQDGLSTTNNLLYLTGTAPIEVKQLLLNGVSYPVTWTSVTNFQMMVILNQGLNTFTLQGVDRFTNAIPGATLTFSVEYTGPVPNPVGALVLSEILYTPLRPGTQFIEIVNRSPQNFDLTGWRLDGANLTFPVGSIVTNGQTLVLTQNRALFRAVYGNIPVFATWGPTLSGRDGVLRLIQPTVDGDILVDGVHYESAAPWVAAGVGQSLQVIDLDQDNSRPSNWGVSEVVPATPGAPNSVAATLPPYDPVWLNEFQVLGLDGPADNLNENDPWIELYNSGTNAVDLSGYFLADNYTTNLAAWAFPAGTLIDPGEYKLIWADGQPEQSAPGALHTGFRLAEDGRLALVRFVNALPQVTDYLTWSTLGVNLSYGAVPDGQAVSRMVIHAPSPGTTNSEPPLRVFINEWMAKNLATLRDPADSAYDDWIELYNAESFAVDLGGFWITDNKDNPMKYHVPTNGQYRIPPRGFFLIWADNTPAQNSGARPDLHTNFRLSDTPGDIGLFRPDGITPVDVVSYGFQTNDVSEGRFADGASTRYFMTHPTPRTPNLNPLYNSPPVFPFIPTTLVAPGQSTTISIRANDPEGGVLTYGIVSAPPISQVNNSGLYRWIVPVTQPVGDVSITVSATDDGVPRRTATATFTMSVRTNGVGVVVIPTTPPSFEEIFTAGGQVSFSIECVPGRTYRVSYSDDLNSGAWTQLDKDFVAAGPRVSLSDGAANPQRFYRVQRLD